MCKPASHPLIQEYVTGVELPTLDVPVRRGKQRYTYRYRWLADVPLRDGKDALSVNWLEIEILNAKGKITYRNSFVTDLPVTPDTVVDLAACGRARWKIENETFNVLKNNGYNLEHSFGHGKQHLAAILVSLNLLAFAIHTVCDIADELWRRPGRSSGRASNFFSNLAADQLSDLSLLGGPASDARLRKAAASPSLNPRPAPPNPAQGPQPTKCNQNENCWCSSS